MSSSDREKLAALLGQEMPLNVAARAMIPGVRSGLVIVDVVRGFCAPGAGNLAPPVPDAAISSMVDAVARAAQAFKKRKLPIFVLCEEHVPGKLEHPYPPHCEKGSGEETLMPEIAWLSQYANATLMPKSCIGGYVGAQRGEKNLLVDWVNGNALTHIVFVGICTDICVLQVVHPILSARNIDLMPSLREVIAYTRGCSTYDLPKEVAEAAGLPSFLAHPRAPAQHLGLYLMQMSGVTLADYFMFR